MDASGPIPSSCAPDMRFSEFRLVEAEIGFICRYAYNNPTAMSLSTAVSSPLMSEDRVFKLALARDYVNYIISGSNKQRFERIHGEQTSETWVATFSGNDLTSRLYDWDGKTVFGPAQRALTRRSVYVHADPWRCTVNIKQVDTFSDGMLETHKFVILPCPTDFLPKQGELVEDVEEFASYLVLQDPELLIAIARNLDLGWSSQIVDY